MSGVSKKRTLDWLESMRSASLVQQLALRISRRGAGAISIDQLAAETGLQADAVHRHVSGLLTNKIVVDAGGVLLAKEALQEAITRIHRQLAKALEQSGDLGIKRSELRSQSDLSPEIFDCAFAVLTREQQLQMDKELIRPAGIHQPDPGGDEDRLSAVARAYEEAGLSSPSPGDLAMAMGIRPAEMRQLITIFFGRRN